MKKFLAVFLVMLMTAACGTGLATVMQTEQKDGIRTTVTNETYTVRMDGFSLTFDEKNIFDYYSYNSGNPTTAMLAFYEWNGIFTKQTYGTFISISIYSRSEMPGGIREKLDAFSEVLADAAVYNVSLWSDYTEEQAAAYRQQMSKRNLNDPEETVIAGEASVKGKITFTNEEGHHSSDEDNEYNYYLFPERNCLFVVMIDPYNTPEDAQINPDEVLASALRWN